MANSNKKIASVDDFKQRLETVITLTDWDEFGERYDLNVRVKKVSMANLMGAGVIPNTLMQKVVSLKDPNRNNKKQAEMSYTPDMVKDSLAAMKAIAGAVLIEPTYEELEDYLTDNQLSQLVSYINGGVESLERFRNEQESIRRSGNSGEIQPEAE